MIRHLILLPVYISCAAFVLAVFIVGWIASWLPRWEEWG